jgi:hypothetical protein
VEGRIGRSAQNPPDLFHAGSQARTNRTGETWENLRDNKEKHNGKEKSQRRCEGLRDAKVSAQHYIGAGHDDVFEEGGRQHVLAYRTNHCVVFLRSNHGHESGQHQYLVFATRMVQGQELRAELVKTSPNLDDAINACNQWENSR